MEKKEGTFAKIPSLPQDCIAHILSLTTPLDVCRSAAVATTFRAAAEADAVWEGFLPADYKDILARASEPVESLGTLSKKELYFRLCRPVLIDGRRRSFSLDKATGKMRYAFSARDMRIKLGDSPQHWSWASLSGSRFPVVAKLLDVRYFKIGVKLRASTLSPNTTYVAYLVYRLLPNARGFSSPPQEAIITMGQYRSKRAIRLQYEKPWTIISAIIPRRRLVPRSGRILENQSALTIVLGEFVVGEGCNENVVIILLEKTQVPKTGLIVEGIEVRPKN